MISGKIKNIVLPTWQRWALFGLLTMTLFVMNVMFHYNAYGTILVSSLWKEPLVFFEFYGIKFLIASAIASFIFLTKRIEWTWLVVIIVNVWIEANLMYYRQCGYLIDTYALLMSGNLDGYTSAALIYWHPQDWYFIGLTILYCVLSFVLSRFTSKQRCPVFFVGIMVLSMLLHAGLRCTQEKRLIGDDAIFRWNILSHDTRKKTYQEVLLVKEHSIIHGFFFDIVDLIIVSSEKYKLTDEDRVEIQSAVGKDIDIDVKAKRSLIIVLVESFENWVITEDIMPNMYRFVHSDKVFYASNVQSQIRQGTSSDGQLIVTTGLLPIQEGATVFRFPQHIYPSYCVWYDHSTMVNPCNEIWNQGRMTEAYHYTDYIVWAEPHDHMVMDSAMTLYEKNDSIQAMMVITSSTHAPFTMSDYPWNYETPADMPMDMKHYIQAFHYLDESIKPLIDKVSTDSTYANTVLVFCADHSVFDAKSRAYYQEYSNAKSLELHPTEAATPIIIYSPDIEGHIHYTEASYQMDVYPTIRHIIGVETYPNEYVGFGKDLLSPEPRRISEDDAYELSDKLIRGNYFEQK